MKKVEGFEKTGAFNPNLAKWSIASSAFP